jgi:hypothetical protein
MMLCEQEMLPDLRARSLGASGQGVRLPHAACPRHCRQAKSGSLPGPRAYGPPGAFSLRGQRGWPGRR